MRFTFENAIKKRCCRACKKYSKCKITGCIDDKNTCKEDFEKEWCWPTDKDSYKCFRKDTKLNKQRSN